MLRALKYKPSFLRVLCRYIKETNIKNHAEDLNALINTLTSDVVTWTPQPGSVLDLGLTLNDPTDRLVVYLSALFTP